MSILVAYDTDEVGPDAVAFAVERAGEGETVEVVHVLHEPDRTRADVEREIRERADAPADAYSVTVVDYHESDATNVSVAKQLLDMVAAGEYDLVVMGNRPHGALEELVVGSVTKAVIESRSVPVALVP